MPTHIKPKFSIVAVTRNDNHGGDLNKRMQLFIDGLFEQCEKYKFFVEILLVEWNPPGDRCPLIQSLNWERQGQYSEVKIITVPEEIHRTYRHSDKMPLFQMIGKNVGIRRATGDFILATNIDILFSDELFAYLAQADLYKNKLYRIDRIDVENQVPLEAFNEEKLKYCRENIIRRNGRYFTESALDNERHDTYNPAMVEVCEKHHLDCLIHTNACGDFQMMSRENWNELRGYPEFDMYSLHIDSIFEYMAFHNGIKEVIINSADAGHEECVTYHMEHHSGYRPEDTEDIVTRFMRRGIFCLSYKQLLIIAIRMLKDTVNIPFNSEEWGLSELSLDVATVKHQNVIPNKSEKEKYVFRPKDICDTDLWIEAIEADHRNEYSFNESDFVSYIRSKHFCPIMLLTNIEFPEDFFSKLANGKIEIIAFGASAGYKKYFMPMIKHYQIKPKYIVDNDVKKVGGLIDNVMIKDADSLLMEKKGSIYIFVTSQYYEEIRVQLIKMGFTEYYDFSSTDFYTNLFWRYLICYVESKEEMK